VRKTKDQNVRFRSQNLQPNTAVAFHRQHSRVRTIRQCVPHANRPKVKSVLILFGVPVPRCADHIACFDRASARLPCFALMLTSNPSHFVGKSRATPRRHRFGAQVRPHASLQVMMTLCYLQHLSILPGCKNRPLLFLTKNQQNLASFNVLFGAALEVTQKFRIKFSR